MSAHFVSWSAAITHLADVKAHVSVLEYQRSDARGDRGTETLKMWNLPARLHNHYRKVSARSAESELRELSRTRCAWRFGVRWLRQDRAKIASQEANDSSGW